MKMVEITFEDVAPFVLNIEGGLSMNPKDKGNWTGGEIGKGILKGTKGGVSAASYPNLDIKNLTIPEITEIFKRDYWLRYKCGEIPNEIRPHFFDVAINSGGSRAIKILQRSIGATPDGIIGAKTRALYNRVSVDLYDWERNAFYIKLVEIEPVNIEFLEGWLFRVRKVTRFTNNLLSL